MRTAQKVCKTFNHRLSAMDIKQLISEVERFPEIWNPKHSLYHHRPRLAEIWSEIATKTKLPSKKSEIFLSRNSLNEILLLEAICKSKWKSLRDNYRREYKKTLKHRLINAAAISGWVHFYHLKFLETVLDTKQMQSQVVGNFCEKKVIEIVESESEIEIGDDDIETVVMDDDDGQDALVSMSDENYDYVRQQQEQMRLLNQSSCCRHAPGDEIMHFFKSIAPYLQMMEPTVKLKVRIEIQETILSELSRKNDEIKAKGRVAEKKTETKNVVPTRVSKRIVKKNRKYFRK
jgi:Alcohol dehydrogenase transcription factor Myb/SANT-like/BESS motif